MFATRAHSLLLLLAFSVIGFAVAADHAQIARAKCAVTEYVDLDGACVACTAGYSCNGKKRTKCAPGTASDQGDGVCSMCAPGTFNAYEGSPTCADCPKGTFQAFSGGTACCECCEGFYAASTGSMSCTECEYNKNGKSVPYSLPGSTKASACKSVPGALVPTCNMPNVQVCPAPLPAPSSMKRAARRAARDCPVGFMNCPVFTSMGHGGTECIDVTSNLESCGGCVIPGGSDKDFPIGMDCSEIEHAQDVGCAEGRCVVSSCQHGFVPSANGTSCTAVEIFYNQNIKPHVSHHKILSGLIDLL